MSNIINLSEAEDTAEYLPDMKLWWRPHMAVGKLQELCWAKFEPGGTYPLHSHPYEQVSVVVQGRMLLNVGDETREVGPGDMWFVPADLPHGGEIRDDEQADIWALGISMLNGFVGDKETILRNSFMSDVEINLKDYANPISGNAPKPLEAGGIMNKNLKPFGSTVTGNQAIDDLVNQPLARKPREHGSFAGVLNHRAFALTGVGTAESRKLLADVLK